VSVIGLIYYYFYIHNIQIPYTVSHKFKVREIYPTKQQGREWFINMDDPISDKIFDPGNKITREADGSWQIKGRQTNEKYEDQVRMNVKTPNSQPEWKNVEITGYAKVLLSHSPIDHLAWYARGGRHSSEVPCEGTSLKGRINVDGKVSWIKEIWHTGGYTDPIDVHKVTHSILGRWIGWKVVIYNMRSDKAVKMESYLDDTDTNHWLKVANVIDDGRWYAKESDKVFYSADCGRPKNYIITNSGPIVTYRSDNMMWDFKDLSVREIQPP
jgi:hypothetical protein